MKALLYRGPREVRYESFTDPTPEDAAGAVVRIDACAICGSDLHIYEGHGFSTDTGFCVGHECVGEVVEVGRDVQRFRSGDRVLVSAGVGCARCRACRAGRIDRCETGLPRCFGLAHALEGVQAEAAAVPAADTSLLRIPDGISDRQALLLTDNLPTAWYGAARADIAPGASVAVIGLGPVGQLAVDSAMAMGAARVFAIDRVAERLAAAEAVGAIPVSGDDVLEQVRAATEGRGVDSVVEAVGRDETIELGLHLVRIGGTVSVVGVSQTSRFAFPMALSFVKCITFRIGLCPVPYYWPTLIPLVQSGRLRPERVITHELGLSEGAEAYRLFDDRREGVMKVVLDPAR